MGGNLLVLLDTVSLLEHSLERPSVGILRPPWPDIALRLALNRRIEAPGFEATHVAVLAGMGGCEIFLPAGGDGDEGRRLGSLLPVRSLLDIAE